eukprot:scaffold55337_cov23-Tisochrysis_lutea.AAC.1
MVACVVGWGTKFDCPWDWSEADPVSGITPLHVAAIVPSEGTTSVRPVRRPCQVRTTLGVCLMRVCLTKRPSQVYVSKGVPCERTASGVLHCKELPQRVDMQGSHLLLLQQLQSWRQFDICSTTHR